MTRANIRPWGFAGWRWDLLAQASGRTLEIGCGWGHNFAHYSADASVIASDADPARVRMAAKRRAHVPLAVADAQRLPWPDQTFDTVVGTLVFCSIPHPELALAEVRRVLTLHGRLLLVEHVRSHHPWLARAQDALASPWHRVTGGCNLNRNTEQTVRSAGFDIQRIKIGYSGLLKLMQASVARDSS